MRTLNDYFLQATIADLSTAGSVYVPVPDGGRITDVYLTTANAITVASAKVSIEPNGGSSVLDLTVTVAASGTGKVISGTASGSTYVEKGDMIQIETDGGSTTASAAQVVVVIRR